MKVAFSIEAGGDLAAALCPAFGRAPRFLVHDLETGLATAFDNDAAAGAHGAGTGAAALMARHGVDAVVSGRFGPKAFEALQAAGIGMHVCGTPCSAKDALERFRSGSLAKAEMA